MKIFLVDDRSSSSSKHGNPRWWGRHDSLPGPLLTEKAFGDKMPGSGTGVRVLGGRCPVFVGRAAGFTELRALASLRFTPRDCNKDHLAPVPSLFALSPTRSLSPSFLLVSLSIALCF